MISDRHIATYEAGQTRIGDALKYDHDEDLAHEGDQYRDRREVTR